MLFFIACDKTEDKENRFLNVNTGVCPIDVSLSELKTFFHDSAVSLI